MAVNVVLNGVSYSIPDPGDNTWGQDLTDYFVAQASGLLQKAGGSFTLTAEVDFGATFGLKSAYFKSRGTNPATAGVVRLANAESISWRNAANNANLALTVDTSNVLTFNGTAVQSALSVSDTSTIDLTLAGSALSGIVVDASITNAKLATMAAHSFKGNNTGSIAAPVDLTATQLTAELNAMVGDSGSGGTKGLVPAPGAGDAAKVLTGAGTFVTAGTGTVTSVAMTVPTALFAASPVTGSPVTTTGTLAPTLATQAANTVFAGATSGGSATPAFRALVAADIPLTAMLAKSANYTLAGTDQSVNFTTGASALTATLPTAVGISGRRYTIVKGDTGAGSVSMLTTSSQTIGGLASNIIKLATPLDSITVESDGANWQVIVFNVTVSFQGTCTGRTPLALASTTAFALTSVLDTQSGFNGSNAYTIKIPGVYNLNVWLDGGWGGAIGSSGGNAVFGGNILINGTIVAVFNVRNQVAGNLSSWGVSPFTTVTLAAGDSVTINATTNFTTPGTGTEGRLSIIKVRG